MTETNTNNPDELNFKTWIRRTENISRVATVAIFLALIRCIAEPFRLQYYATLPLSFEDAKPYLIGALVAAVTLFINFFLFIAGKYHAVIVICILGVVTLLVVRQVYLVPRMDF